MPDLMNREWLNFLREFEKTDPEPVMWRIEPGMTGPFDTASTISHMAWHRRLTDAWVKRGIQ